MCRRNIVIVNRFPEYFSFKHCVLGSYAYTTSTDRYILNDYAIDYNGETETPGYHFNRAVQSVRFPKKTMYHDTLSYPYKAIPCSLPYGFYVDIRKAYTQIANVFGLETSHREGRYCGYGQTLAPAITTDNKYARALLVAGTTKQSTITEWTKGELRTRKFNNRNYAPMLSRAILATLHAIQSDVSPYTVYCHTDGFIVPFWHMERVCSILERVWSIEYTIKFEGATTIYGVGSYDCGEHRTRTRGNQQHPQNGIRSEFASWWRASYLRGKSIR